MTENPHKPGRPKGAWEEITVTPELIEAIETVTVSAKQKRVLEIVEENVRNGGEITQKDVLLQAWYSEWIANSPSRVFDSKPFREILEKKLQRDRISGMHDKILVAEKMTVLEFPFDMEEETIKMIVLESGGRFLNMHPVLGNNPRWMVHAMYFNSDAILRALDLAYKVLGYYAPTQTESHSIDLVQLFNAALAARRANS